MYISRCRCHMLCIHYELARKKCDKICLERKELRISLDLNVEYLFRHDHCVVIMGSIDCFGARLNANIPIVVHILGFCAIPIRYQAIFDCVSLAMHNLTQSKRLRFKFGFALFFLLFQSIIPILTNNKSAQILTSILFN